MTPFPGVDRHHFSVYSCPWAKTGLGLFLLWVCGLAQLPGEAVEATPTLLSSKVVPNMVQDVSQVLDLGSS